MEDKSFSDLLLENKVLELLTSKELELTRKFSKCKTLDELDALSKETMICENVNCIQCKKIDMSIEDFKKKYDLVEETELFGKYEEP